MTLEVGADELTIPRPVIFGIRRRMDPDEPTAETDESFERRLFNGIEDVPGRVQENDDSELRQLDFIENRCVFRTDDAKTVFAPQSTNGRDPCRNRIVPESRSLREYENAKPARLCGRPTGSGCDAHPNGHCGPEAHTFGERFAHGTTRSIN